MATRKHLQHIKSSQLDKVPTSNDLLYGEIAINYAKGGETIYIKNNEDEIISFPNNKVIEENEYVVASHLAEIDEKLKESNDTERVIAEALVEHNDRFDELNKVIENNEYVTAESVSRLKNELDELDEIVAYATGQITNRVDLAEEEIDNIYNLIEEKDKSDIIAQSLCDLNERINDKVIYKENEIVDIINNNETIKANTYSLIRTFNANPVINLEGSENNLEKTYTLEFNKDFLPGVQTITWPNSIVWEGNNVPNVNDFTQLDYNYWLVTINNGYLGSYKRYWKNEEEESYAIKIVSSNGDKYYVDCSEIQDNTITQSFIGTLKPMFADSIVYIGDCVESFDDFWTFRETGMRHITIPDSVTSIPSVPFVGCSSLDSIIVDPSNPTYDSRNNCNAVIETATNRLISGCRTTVIPDSVTEIYFQSFRGSSITSVSFPDSVTSILQYAFEDCKSLKNVYIGSGVNYISSEVFYNCQNLSSIIVDSSNSTYDSRNNCNAVIQTATNKLLAGCTTTVIPNSVTRIGGNSFYGSNLESITIPESVTQIDNNAFTNCARLTSVTLLSTTPPTLNSSAFSGTNSALKIYVPASSVNTYKSASNWSSLSSKIEAIPGSR